MVSRMVKKKPGEAPGVGFIPGGRPCWVGRSSGFEGGLSFFSFLFFLSFRV
jgi:hypothetical protein